MHEKKKQEKREVTIERCTFEKMMTTTFWPMEHLEVQTQHSLTTTCCNFVHQRYIGMQNLRLLMGVGFVAAAEVNSNPRNIIKIHNNVTWD